MHEAAFRESIRLSVEVSRVPFQNIQIRNISLKNMSDIGGGLFFNDAALNVMIYTYVFFFSGEGVSLSSTYTLNTKKGWIEMFSKQLKIHTHFKILSLQRQQRALT